MEYTSQAAGRLYWQDPAHAFAAVSNATGYHHRLASAAAFGSDPEEPSSTTLAIVNLRLALSALLLVFYPVVVIQLRRQDLKVLPNKTGAIKALLTLLLAAVKLGTLVVGLTLSRRNADGETIAANAVAFVASLVLCHLSFLEHGRTVKPSTLLTLYLLVIAVYDSINLLRALSPLPEDLSLQLALSIGTAGLEVLLFVVESLSKRSYLRQPYQELPVEQTIGVVNKAFLFWINDLILLGNAKILSVTDLPALDDPLKSEPLRQRMEAAWAKASKNSSTCSKSKWPTTMFIAWFRCFSGSLLAAAIPRMFLVVFLYAQPILINRTIQYVTQPATEDADDKTGKHLIIAAIVIYSATAIFRCIYQQLLNRITIQSRGALIGLIHSRSLTLLQGAHDDAAAVTHMSSDVDSINHFSYLLQESWADILEVVVGMTLLWNQIGWWCLTPLALVVLCSVLAGTMSGFMRDAFMGWQASKQKRVAITTSMLDSIKNIKMMGMATTVMTRIQNARVFEIGEGNKFRWFMCYFNLIAWVVNIFGPPITLALYAITSSRNGEDVINPVRAFTAIAIINLISQPAIMLLAILPEFAGIAAAAQRIQDYLLKPSVDDQRILLNSSANGNDGSNGSSEPVALDIAELSLRPAPSANICLENINIKIAQGSLTVLCGAVGTGKTTLAKAILGELAPQSGTISVSSTLIGYCAQKPWLVNASIKDNICGPLPDSEIDTEWYNTVLRACDLEEDLAQISGGDTGLIGSRGTTLSGGQKQRVALARAIYSRPSIVILDDVLSALDSKTETRVANNLLGVDGLFRKLHTTVILITHASQHLPLADHIVLLAGSTVGEQGTWEQLRSSEGEISKLQVKESSDKKEETDEVENSTAVPETAPPSKDVMMDLTRKVGDASVYVYYFTAAGLWTMFFFVVMNIIYGALLAINPSILRAWSESDGNHPWFYIGMYGVSSVCAYISIFLVLWLTVIKIGPQAGESLHYTLLKTIMRAPLSYFAITDSGTILNRFSQDISYVDMRLPMSLLVVVLQTSKLISQLFLLFISEAFMALCAPVLFTVLYFLQKLYLYTSRQIRYLDLEMRASVYSNFLETLEGISTIRALRWQGYSVRQNINNLDRSQQPNYMMETIQLWLVLVLDLLVTGLAVLIVSLAVTLRSTTTGGQIGVALNIVVAINFILVQLLEQWTQLETSLGAIARIKSLEATLEPEDKPGEDFVPAQEWPDKGAIEFRDVTAAYNPDAIALKNISVKILPGQKIGICGRTGSGKSSLLLSLLRLIEIDSGSILIDGLNLSILPRDTVRSSLIVIPQDTFILDDSIRVNLDPSGTVSDEDLIAALTKVQLWDVIKARQTKTTEANGTNGNTNGGANGATSDNQNGGAESSSPSPPDGSAAPSQQGEDAAKEEKEVDPLDGPLKGSPLSHGQFQLFGLARALLLKQRSSILVLDEATSNVDAKTDTLMQQIIREEFGTHTILSIAHRLDTIRDADRIMVLNDGRVVEFGSPDELLQKTRKKDASGSSGASRASSDDGNATAATDTSEIEERAWFRELWDKSH
ncbi:hypothetical protein BX600DRAFT_469082 [Xylariales sp. PMI_506]|nr:hypothetical protein BX600DRAFT_469082 [Xylariales sp. PMI_506]